MTRFTRALCSQTKDKELIVYGTGAVGEVVSHALLAWGRKPDLYCDHNPEQHVFLDREVIRPEQLSLHPDAIVILAFKDFLRTAVSVLRDAGIQNYYSAEDLIDEPLDIVPLSKGAREFLIRKNHYSTLVSLADANAPLVLQHLEWMLTERCTLRCRDCSALISCFDHPRDHDYNITAAALDRVLAAVDFVSELSILGGEPLLYTYLADAIAAYSGHEKIGAVVIYTNGTIMPNESQLTAMQGENVWVHISDYGAYSVQITNLEEICRQRGIRYFIKQYDTWQSAGTLQRRDEDETRLSRKYRRCFKARCFSLFEDRLYGCARASNGAAAGKLPDQDYISFSELRSASEDKAQILRLIGLPFLDACRYCGGMIEGNADVMPAIQQQG